MNKERIDKNKILDLFFKYMSESNDPSVFFCKTKNMPAVYFGIHNAEYRFYADKANNSLRIESYFTNKDDNFQIHKNNSGTASLFNIPRSIYEMMESRLIENEYTL